MRLHFFLLSINPYLRKSGRQYALWFPPLQSYLAHSLWLMHWWLHFQFCPLRFMWRNPLTSFISFCFLNIDIDFAVKGLISFYCDICANCCAISSPNWLPRFVYNFVVANSAKSFPLWHIKLLSKK